jgi:hypothetical protein
VNGNKIIELRHAREVRNNVVYTVNVVKDNMGVVAVLAMHSVNRNNDTKEESEKRDVNVIMNEDNPEQMVEMNIIDKDHGEVDVIDADSDVIMIGIDFDFEYNKDVVETVEMQVHKKPRKRDGARRPCSQSSQPRSTTPFTQSGTTTPAVARYDSVPLVTFCVLKLTSQRSGVKLPGMREVMLKTNLKGKYDDNFNSEYNEDEGMEKQLYEKPEEQDVGDDIDSDADTEYDEDEGVEMNIINEDLGDVDLINSDSNVIGIDFNFEYNEDVVETVEMQVHEKPEKRDGARRPCSQSSQPRSTTPVTHSGTITPAVARYDSVPIVTLCMLKLTSQSLGVKLPGMREVMIKTNLKGKYDSDVDSEYTEDEVVEKQLYDTPRLGREENEQKVSQMEEDNLEKEETEKKSKNKSEVQGDGLDDAKEAIEINEVDMVREYFAGISLKAKNKELNLLTEKSFGLKGKDDEAEEETEAKVGTSAEQEKSPTDNTANTDRPGTMKGDVTGEDDQGQISIFTHVMDQKYDDESAIDKADGKDGGK